ISFFLLPGTDPFIASKIVQILIGAFAITAVHTLIQDNSNGWIYYFILASITIFILHCAFLVLTPDLLFLTLTLWYAMLLKKKVVDSEGIFYPIITGIIGALLYFSKGIG